MALASPAAILNEENIHCSVCMEGHCYETDQIVYCDGCDLAVHQSCYGGPWPENEVWPYLPPEGDWFCDVCKDKEDIKKVRCVLCRHPSEFRKKTKQSEKQNEKVLKRNEQDWAFRAFKRIKEPKYKSELLHVKKRWGHVACALWFPGVWFVDAVSRTPIGGVNKIKARHKLKCSICGLKGGCIQCRYPRCLVAFHPLCALKAKKHMVEEWLDDKKCYDRYVLCSTHRPGCCCTKCLQPLELEKREKKKVEQEKKWAKEQAKANIPYKAEEEPDNSSTESAWEENSETESWHSDNDKVEMKERTTHTFKKEKNKIAKETKKDFASVKGQVTITPKKELKTEKTKPTKETKKELTSEKSQITITPRKESKPEKKELSDETNQELKYAKTKKQRPSHFQRHHQQRQKQRQKQKQKPAQPAPKQKKQQKQKQKKKQKPKQVKVSPKPRRPIHFRGSGNKVRNRSGKGTDGNPIRGAEEEQHNPSYLRRKILLAFRRMLQPHNAPVKMADDLEAALFLHHNSKVTRVYLSHGRDLIMNLKSNNDLMKDLCSARITTTRLCAMDTMELATKQIEVERKGNQQENDKELENVRKHAESQKDLLKLIVGDRQLKFVTIPKGSSINEYLS